MKKIYYINLIIVIGIICGCKKLLNSNDRPKYCDVYGNIQYVQENEDYTFAWTTDDQKADMFIKWTSDDVNTEGFWRNKTLANTGHRLKNITLSVAIEGVQPDFYVKNITLSDRAPSCR